MSEFSGWRPLQKPQRAPTTGLAPLPFTRLARLHALSALADGLITVALAGSIFFSIEPGAARWRVALYLVLTIAPFAVVTPLIGPVVDRSRGGRRGMILGTAFARAIVVFLMVGKMHSILLFPLAFVLLVLQRAYIVAKSAVVPKLVDSERQLVEANSKLALLSAIGTMGGAAFGAVLSFIGGVTWPAGVAVLVYIAAGLSGIALPRIAIADLPMQENERAELRGAGIVLAGSAMGVLRGIVGFLTFLLAFELRGGKDGVDIKPLGAAAGAATAIARKIDIVGDPGAPAWHFGVVVAAAGIGALVGARVAPQLRRRVHEEYILLGVLAGTALAGVVAAWDGGLFGAVLLSFVVALAAGSGKLAFDSLVQRDAPDANYGRSFARFEGRFQLTWVAGAFVPVVLRLPARVGFVFVAMAAGFSTVSYFLGTRASPALADADEQQPGAGPVVAGDVDRTQVFPTADPTALLPAGEAMAQPAPTGEPPRVTEQPCTPGPARWSDVAAVPVVSSVEGVEIDPELGRTSPAARPPSTS